MKCSKSLYAVSAFIIVIESMHEIVFISLKITFIMLDRNMIYIQIFPDFI